MTKVEEIAAKILDAARKRAASRTELESTEPAHCQKCDDRGVVFVLTDTQEEVEVGDIRLITQSHYVKPCSCVDRNRIDQLFRSSHVTAEFQKVGFKDFKVEGRPQAVKAARDIAVDYYKRFDDIRGQREGNSLSLSGPPGVGKTHLAMAVANGLMRKGIGVQYFPWVEGFNDLRNKLDKLEERASTMKQVDVLFIDDLYKGRERPTEFMIEQLYGIVNYRYMNAKPMIVSTERSVDDLFTVDGAIARRLHEMAYGHRIEIGSTPEEEKSDVQLNYSLVKA